LIISFALQLSYFSLIIIVYIVKINMASACRLLPESVPNVDVGTFSEDHGYAKPKCDNILPEAFSINEVK
jgi:hypothetical protein